MCKVMQPNYTAIYAAPTSPTIMYNTYFAVQFNHDYLLITITITRKASLFLSLNLMVTYTQVCKLSFMSTFIRQRQKYRHNNFILTYSLIYVASALVLTVARWLLLFADLSANIFYETWWVIMKQELITWAQDEAGRSALPVTCAKTTQT